MVVDVSCGVHGAGGGGFHLPLTLRVVDLPLSVREVLDDGVEGSTPPSRHVVSNHDPCRSLNRQGGFAGGSDARRGARIPVRAWAERARKLRHARDARGSAGCAWAAPFGKLVRRVGLATLVRDRRHNAIDAGITEMSPAGALEVT